MFIRTLFLLLIAVHLHGNVFDDSFSKSSDVKIEYFQIMGERCSGTKFITKLIIDNFPSITQTERYGHKHFLPWLKTPSFSKNKRWLDENAGKSFFQNSSNCLFVVVIRDPYDWLRSFYNTPYHVSNNLKKDFSTFISQKWSTYEPSLSSIENINPWTNKPFSNVLELRNYKNENYVTVSNFVQNYILVRYEDVRDNSNDFIDFLSSKYNAEKTPTFIAQDCYVGHTPSKKAFTAKSYFSLSDKEIMWINSHLDWDIENKLGFAMKTNL